MAIPCECGGHTQLASEVRAKSIYMGRNAFGKSIIGNPFFDMGLSAPPAFMPPKLSYCSKAEQLFNEVSRY